MQVRVSISMYRSGGTGEDRAERVSEGTRIFRDISLSNILARGAKTAGEILGLPDENSGRDSGQR